MKVGIIGSGGREHAICESIKNSPKIKKIFCFPGNAGTENIAENTDINIENFDMFKKFIKKNNIDLIIVGPEKPLVNGIVDFLEKNEIKVFGPNKFASRLEGSKIFTKKLCEDNNIPTAKFGIFENIERSIEFINQSALPVVIKADGLAAGKGVYISQTKKEAEKAIYEIFNGKFGDSKTILIEEFLKGEEMSFFIISDGKNFKKLGTAQAHKRVGEGDTGLNTGGMGAYSPSRFESDSLDKKIMNKIIKPTLSALQKEGISFKGFLYAGLMIVKNEPYLIEYNVRMGDPECQTILPRLKTDFFEIILSAINQKLNTISIDWHDSKSLSIVLCSKGYPEKYQNNKEIKNLSDIKLSEDQFIFHAGTKKINNKVYSNGGRVLNIVVRSNNFQDCRHKALDLIKKINWEHGFFRKDIGHKVIT